MSLQFPPDSTLKFLGGSNKIVQSFWQPLWLLYSTLVPTAVAEKPDTASIQPVEAEQEVEQEARILIVEGVCLRDFSIYSSLFFLLTVLPTSSICLHNCLHLHSSELHSACILDCTAFIWNTWLFLVNHLLFELHIPFLGLFFWNCFFGVCVFLWFHCLISVHQMWNSSVNACFLISLAND